MPVRRPFNPNIIPSTVTRPSDPIPTANTMGNVVVSAGVAQPPHVHPAGDALYAVHTPVCNVPINMASCAIKAATSQQPSVGTNADAFSNMDDASVSTDVSKQSTVCANELAPFSMDVMFVTAPVSKWLMG